MPSVPGRVGFWAPIAEPAEAANPQLSERPVATLTGEWVKNGLQGFCLPADADFLTLQKE